MITSESLNTILNRNKIKKEVENILSLFENDINNVMKKGIFIQGPPGCGKTYFIKNILKDLGYYDKYSEEYDIDAIFEQRERLYRRLKDGNESSQKNSHG